MFSSVGWAEIVILMIAGLVILGPERLPDAVKWTLKSVRQVRDYATGATSALKQDLGADFEDLRKPLAELNELRGMTPRNVITKHLLNGDESFFTGNFDGTDSKIKPVSQPLPTTDANSQVVSMKKGDGVSPAGSKGNGASSNGTLSSGAGASSTKTLTNGSEAQPAATGTDAAGVDRWDAT